MSQNLSAIDPSLQALLSALVESGIQLRADGGQLRVLAARGQLTPELRDRISQHKPALLALLDERGAMDETLPPLQRQPGLEHEPFPLTEAQQAYWLGRQDNVELGGFSTHFYVELQRPGLDLGRLEDALQQVIARHGMLRAVFTADGRQRVLADVPRYGIAVQDLRSINGSEVEPALASWRAELSGQTIAPDRWPLFDIRAALLPDGALRLLFCVDMLLMDATSVFLCLDDWRHCYENPNDPLPPLGLSCRDYVMFERSLETTAAYRKARDYWMARIDQLPSAPALPLHRQPASLPEVSFTRRVGRLSGTRWAALKQRAREHGATPSAILLAAFSEVLRAWSTEPSFTLNLTLFNRLPVYPDVKRLVGDFTTTTLLALYAQPGDRFTDRLKRLQRQLAEDLEHRAYSGMRVLRERSRRVGAKAAAMPVVFTSTLALDGKQQGSEGQAWFGEYVYGVSRTPQVWLDHQTIEWQDELGLLWDSVDALFPPGLLDDMLSAYVRLLERLADEPAAWLEHGFDLLPAGQRARRDAANDTAAPRSEILLHYALEQAAQHAPDKTAVVTPQRTLTRAKVDQLANRLAHALRDAGVQAGARVAICIDKGWQQAVAAFGVLKAGAAYVPLDPHWPDTRLAELLESTGARVMLVASDQQMLPLLRDVTVLRVDDDALAHWPHTALEVTVSADALAYIIYTSGSTGRPKGVAVSHRAAVNTIADINRRFGIGEGDVVFGLSALHFDLSVYDLFGTPAAGATLVLPGAAEITDPLAWAASVRRHGVTVWNSVPALMQLLAETVAGEGGALPSLKTVMLSGDWIPLSLPAAVHAVAPHAHVISLGGATEAGIWSIWHPADTIEPHWNSIPYGRPLANQRWHILDANGQDMPEWVAGPLHIAGDGLAEGYWGDPARTAEAFFGHPRTGERLYRTGDLGRYLPDGNIEFLGRADLQLKIQGLRVEPGEVEHALLGHPAVASAAVVATGEHGRRQLVGFAVPRAGQTVDGETLRGFLIARLPGHMVPPQVLLVPRWPLTPNGKLDRAALMRHAAAAAAAPRDKPGPLTAKEQLIADIWKEVLNLSAIGRDDDFFALGGESFSAIQAMTRLGQRLGVRLPLAALLEGRTVAGLAQRLTAVQAPPSPRLTLGLPGKETAPPLVLVHPAGGHVLCYRALAELVASDGGRAVFGLQAPGLGDGLSPIDDLQTLVASHLRQLPPGPCVLGGWSAGGILAFEMARQREKEGMPVQGLVLIDAPSPWPDAPQGDDLTMLAAFLRDADLGFNVDLLTPAEKASHPTLQTLVPLLCERQGLTLPTDLAQLNTVLKVFIATLSAARGCQPGTIKSDLLVIKAADLGSAEFAVHPQSNAPDWGWSAWTTGWIETLTLPGNHHAVLAVPLVQRTAHALMQWLARR